MNNTLQHVGILGMHWGRRKSSEPSADHIKVQPLRRKKLHEMSNDEIRTLTSRMQLESQYKNLNPGKIARGKKRISNIVSVVGQITAAAGTITAAAALGKKIIGPSIGLFEGELMKDVARGFIRK